MNGLERSRSHEVALADLYAVVTHDVVRGGAVKKEVRHRAVEQKLDAFHLHFAGRALHRDHFVFGAVDLLRLDRLQPRDRLLDAIDELREALLVILELRRLAPARRS
jgi:hypothetical protein